MTRSRRSAKTAGTRFERVIADHLAEVLDDDRIDRRVRNGSKDCGDIAGLRTHGQRLVVEVKDCAKLNLPGWIREAHIEAAHDDALCGVVIYKRCRVGDPGRQWVAMELKDLIALITGQPQQGRYE